MTPTMMIGIGIALFVAALAICFGVARLRQRHSPWGLFRSLCSAHRLSVRERRLLTHLAWQHQLRQPAMLFLDATLWDAERLGPDWNAQAKNLGSLRERLFQRQ